MKCIQETLNYLSSQLSEPTVAAKVIVQSKILTIFMIN